MLELLKVFMLLIISWLVDCKKCWTFWK